MNPLTRGLAVITFIFFFSSCTKSTDAPDPVKVDADTIPRLVKMIYNYQFALSDTILSDTIKTGYKYDASGNLVLIFNAANNAPVTALEYNGSQLAALVNYDGYGKPEQRHENFISYKDNGNLLSTAYYSTGLGADTMLASFSFENDRLVSQKIYVGDTMFGGRPIIDTMQFTFDENKNAKQYSSRWGLQWTQTEVDDKKNIFLTFPTDQYVIAFSASGSLYQVRQTNNPKKIVSPGGFTTTFEYTYDEHGYPLTQKQSGNPGFTLEAEFFYEY